MTRPAQLPIQLVIGPHRSGTSVTTQILSVLGLDLGHTLMRPSHDNPQGFWENEKIVNIHDELINALGKDWTTAAFIDEGWIDTKAADHAEEALIDVLNTDFTSENASLVKDPRLCVLFPLWERIAKKLDRPLHVLGVMRYPGAVSQSVQNRNFLTEKDADLLVSSHYYCLFQAVKDSQPSFLVYENLAGRKGQDIINELTKTLPHLDIRMSENRVNVIGRLINPKPVSDDATASRKDYEAFIEAEGLLMAWDKVAPVMETFANVESSLKPNERDTLLPVEETIVAVPKETLSKLHDELSDLARNVEDEQSRNQGFIKQYEKERDRAASLAGGINERDATITALQNSQAKDRDQLGSLQGGIVERDATIHELRQIQVKDKARISNLGDEAAELDARIKKLTAAQILDNERIGALEGGIRERDEKIEAILTVEEQDKERIGALEGGIVERDDKIKELLAEQEKDKERIGALEGGIIERDELVETIRASEKTLQQAIRALESDLSQREHDIKQLIVDQKKERKRISTLDSKVKSTVQEKEKLTAELAEEKNNAAKADARTVEHKKTIKSLRAKSTREGKKLTALKIDITDQEDAIETLGQENSAAQGKIRELDNELSNRDDLVYDLQRRLSERDEALAELQRIKDMQDLTIEMEGVRSKMVEDQLSGQLSAVVMQLSYYQKSPIKAGVKRATFKTLSAVRHGLPLPESFKLETARKLTGFAQGLQPPGQHQRLEAPQALSESYTANFAFKETDNPVISIIIPVYNEISQTIACLKSVYQQQCEVDFEVIIADDASPDPFHTVLQGIGGLRYFRNEENQHFLRNCNINAKHARGDYLVFLNNDTLVKQGWLQNLYRTFFEHGDVGIVGSKLVFPSGELQEAGGIIWEDASGWNWGRGQDPEHPKFNYVRDADYVSGASLMIPTKLWEEVGGFDEAYEKAYYEDTDLCFKIRSMGHRVLYQPSSVVIHIEGLSSGTDVNQGAKQYQLVNEKIFRKRWADALGTHLPNGTTPEIASDRHIKGHILYIDAVTPEPQKDSGSLDAVYAMRILTGLGYRVHFVPGSNFAHWGSATEALQKQGIECIYHPHYSNIDSLLKDRGDMFDYVMVSRAESADLYLSKINKKCPSAKTIFNTVDVHHLRMERRAKITNDPEVALAAKDMRKKELGFMRTSDATIVLSEVEHSILSKLSALKKKLWIIPLIRAKSERLVTYKKTKDIVFIGGYNHPPNVDAVDWLVEKLWPEIRKGVPDAKLIVCGSNMPDRFQDFARDDILIKGFVPDLNALLSQSRLTIAPLRFGAGLKGKVASSIGAGVPCVGTPIAFEGMAEKGLKDIRLLAETPKAFAEQIAKVYKNEKLWTKISKAGVVYHNENYAYENVAHTFSDMLKSLK